MMSRHNIAVAFAILAGGLSTQPSQAEVCGPPIRSTERFPAPCGNAQPISPAGGITVTPLPIFGPWLSSCATYYGHFSKSLGDSIENPDPNAHSRIPELYEGNDIAWTPTAPFPTACNLVSSGAFAPEVTSNHLNNSCGDLPKLQIPASGPDFSMLLQQPTNKTKAFQSYRAGAWIQSLRVFNSEVIQEVQNGGLLQISPACEPLRETITTTLQALGQARGNPPVLLSFKDQPNIDSISGDQDPCPSQFFGGTAELDQFLQNAARAPASATHFDPNVVRNRMSGCLLISARKRIETAFVQLAACEVRARATAVDREFFVADTCPTLSGTPGLSIFDQLIREQLLKGDCENQAYRACSVCTTSAIQTNCTADAGFDKTIDGCWSCFSQKLQACVASDLPKFLSSTSFSPALSVSLAVGNLPANLRTISKVQPSTGCGVSYTFSKEGCTDTSLPGTQGCPNISTALMTAGVTAALENLDSTLVAADSSESPLSHALEMDSSQDNQEFNRGTEMPLDGIGPTVIFAGPVPAAP